MVPAEASAAVAVAAAASAAERVCDRAGLHPGTANASTPALAPAPGPMPLMLLETALEEVLTLVAVSSADACDSSGCTRRHWERVMPTVTEPGPRGSAVAAAAIAGVSEGGWLMEGEGERGHPSQAPSVSNASATA
jgi:hypothetical protein